jgi:hypothetical protein
LCGNKEKSTVNFQMGGVLRLRCLEPGQWAVEWMIVPGTIL